MKNLMKLIVIAAMTALLLFAAMSFAAADEKIYTSPVFKLPADKITDWLESQPEDQTEPEPGEQPGDETEPDETEPDENEPDESEPETGSEAGSGERRIRIFSSQGSTVTEGEIIYLTSSVEGFGDAKLSYQWQVDRGDGAGWVDVEGADRDKHMFVASRETIMYSWRLIVNVVE